MDSQPQNPEFRNNPENFRPCMGESSKFSKSWTFENSDLKTYSLPTKC